MANQYKVIDESKWERAMHCMVFRNSVEPAFCVTFEAHHSFVDGLHIGQFADALQNYLSSF